MTGVGVGFLFQIFRRQQIRLFVVGLGFGSGDSQLRIPYFSGVLRWIPEFFEVLDFDA